MGWYFLSLVLYICFLLSYTIKLKHDTSVSIPKQEKHNIK